MIYEPMPAGKVCPKCKKWKPLSSYYLVRRGKPQRQARCKPCSNADNRALYAKNSEPYKEYQHKLRRERGEEIRSQQRERWAKNPDKFRAFNRQSHQRRLAKDPDYDRRANMKYQRNHPERCRAANRRSYAKDPHKATVRVHVRRTRLAGTEGQFTPADVQRQYDAQGGLCYWCSKPLSKSFHDDHVIPISRGGTSWPDNIVCTCPRCNESKGAKLPFTEWQPPNPLKRP